MKCLQVTLTALFLVLLPSARGEFQELFFGQKLLPIDRFDTRIWQNRYHLDDSNYTAGGPLFVMISGTETFGTAGLMDYSYFFDMARDMGALLVYTEHRFYGKSRPTADVSMANLQFLDTRYAVDDVANLVTYLRDRYETGPVIAHGFDHGGAIAVWLAHRYPRLVTGLWAASATLVAEKDFTEFLDNVAYDIRVIGGDECYRQTEEAFDRMEYLYASGNYRELEETFNLCTNFTAGDESEGFAFFYTYAISLGTLIRYSHRIGVETLCAYYSSHEHPMMGLASFITNILPTCVNIIPDPNLVGLDKETWDDDVNIMGLRQMTYQYCREFGWYTTSSGTNHPFGNRFPIEIFQKACQDIFGRIFSASNMMTFMDQTNQIFGGNRPNITNAYFTVGDFDPKKGLGVLDEYRPSIHVDIIPDFGAGAEILPKGFYPLPQVEAVQDRARELIGQWVADASNK